MRNKLSAFLMVLLFLAATVAGQSQVSALGPYPFILTTNTSVSIGLSGQPNCTVSVASAATMGGGTLTIGTMTGGVAGNVTGFPDPGSGSNGSQTISAAGNKLTVPTGSSQVLTLTLAGATSPNVFGNVYCAPNLGLVASSGGGGGGGTVTCASPGCVIASLPPAAISSLPPVSVSTLPPVVVSSAPPMVCGNPYCTVNTPAPAPTNATDSGINVHIAGSTAAPIAVTTPSPNPTASNGGIKVADGVCTSLASCSSTIGDTAFSQAVTTTLTQVIAAPASGSIRITSIQALGEESATGGFMELEYGTGTNCATGTTLLAVLLYLNTTAGAAQQMSWGNGAGSVLIVPATKALCVTISAGTVTAAQIAGTYAEW